MRAVCPAISTLLSVSAVAGTVPEFNLVEDCRPIQCTHRPSGARPTAMTRSRLLTTCASATCSTACKTANKCGGSSSVASTIMPIRMAGSFARKTAIVGTIVHSDYCTACGMIGHRASECTTFAPNSRLETLVNEVLEGTTLDWEVCARTH